MVRRKLRLRHRHLHVTGTIFARKADRERGASAVLVAASMLMLIGFAAIAVDGGIVFDDRRQQQSAADVGSLAALQFARTTLATGRSSPESECPKPTGP